MSALYTDAMAAAITGVTVVTTDGAAGRLGRTVSAMTSVSAEPPMLLACVARRSPLVAAIRAHGAFAVSVLARHQVHVAESFAGRGRGDRFSFACAEWEPGVTGAPLLRGAAARFECRVASVVEAGSHSVLLGRVVAAAAGEAPALAYTRRGYLDWTG
jgi:flavin reductase (DIM6/NTAB) family NADH-FMN oxidoreductase RutF